MNARTAPRLLSLLALAAGAGCGEVPSSAPLAPARKPQFATIADISRSYPALGAAVSYTVNGPFHDVVQFTTQSAGTYRVTVRGNTQIVGCSGRYCRSPGTLKALLSGVQLQSAAGAPVTTVNGTTTVTLSAGTWLLVVDGAGVGTGRYANTGSYTVTVMMPVVAVPTCEAVRSTMLARGYSSTEIEARITALLAMTPPGCSDD